MREFTVSLFSASVFLLGAEIVAYLFPQRSGKLIHGLAVLLLLATLLRSALRIELPEIEMQTDTGSWTSQTQTYTAETTALFLRKRLASLCESAGITLSGGENGVLIAAFEGEEGEISIDHVRVLVLYEEDVRRAESLLQSLFSGTVPIEVVTDNG